MYRYRYTCIWINIFSSIFMLIYIIYMINLNVYVYMYSYRVDNAYHIFIYTYMNVSQLSTLRPIDLERLWHISDSQGLILALAFR